MKIYIILYDLDFDQGNSPVTRYLGFFTEKKKANEFVSKTMLLLKEAKKNNQEYVILPNGKRFDCSLVNYVSVEELDEIDFF